MDNIFVTNTPVFIWRKNPSRQKDNHHHYHVSCWYVVTSEGFVIAGGYTSGDNLYPGEVEFATRKEAIAFVHGFKRGLSDGVKSDDIDYSLNNLMGNYRSSKLYYMALGANISNNILLIAFSIERIKSSLGNLPKVK